MPDTTTPTDVIVVPLDGSARADRAVPIATRLLGAGGGRLILLSVGSGDRVVELRRHLHDVAASLPDTQVDTVVASSDDAFDDAGEAAADAIVACAEEHGATVCMTSHGRGALRWAMLGSVAERVVAASSRPVVLVGPHCDAAASLSPGPVLLCHAGADLSDAVADAACAAARRFDTSILLATVFHPLDVLGAEYPTQLYADAERRIRARGCSVDHVLEQRRYPAGVLADMAMDRESPAIVMGTHRRRGVARMVLGSTTMSVLNLAPCPVIAVRAEA
jgi:nucleotide-binding universal stress UspA family protein